MLKSLSWLGLIIGVVIGLLPQLLQGLAAIPLGFIITYLGRIDTQAVRPITVGIFLASLGGLWLRALSGQRRSTSTPPESPAHDIQPLMSPKPTASAVLGFAIGLAVSAYIDSALPDVINTIFLGCGAAYILWQVGDLERFIAMSLSATEVERAEFMKRAERLMWFGGMTVIFGLCWLFHCSFCSI